MYDREGNRKYLNQREREAFLRAVKTEAHPAKRTFGLTLFYTGCRISEALNVPVQRLDVAGKAVIFETLKRRKNGNFRSVPIPDFLMAELDRIGNGTEKNRRLWAFSRTTGYRLVKWWMGQVGISGVKACPKGLRHGFAIACLSKNIPLTTVKKWLGHARLETTAIYLDVIGEEERELARRLWRTP
jgi:integrase/recombinase XerD